MRAHVSSANEDMKRVPNHCAGAVVGCGRGRGSAATRVGGMAGRATGGLGRGWPGQAKTTTARRCSDRAQQEQASHLRHEVIEVHALLGEVHRQVRQLAVDQELGASPAPLEPLLMWKREIGRDRPRSRDTIPHGGIFGGGTRVLT